MPWLPRLGVGTGVLEGKQDLKTVSSSLPPYHCLTPSPGKVEWLIFCPSASAPPPRGPTHTHDLAILSPVLVLWGDGQETAELIGYLGWGLVGGSLLALVLSYPWGSPNLGLDRD